MGDYKFFGGAVWGPATIRQHAEMTPYGMDYRRAEFHFGFENTRYFPFIPFVPASWARTTFLIDGSFEDTAGGQINLGSRRTAGFLRPGLRFRLTPPGVIVGDVRLGLGAASNELNFGKGANPPHAYSLNVQMQATVGVIFCLNPDFCLGPLVGVSVDEAFSTGGNYTSGHSPFFGFRMEGQVNPPSPSNVGASSCKKEKKECEDRVKVVIEEKEKWRTQYERVVEARRTDDADAEPSIPEPAAEKGPDSPRYAHPRPSAARTAPSSRYSRAEKFREIEYQWFRELPKGIYFQNQEADLLPLPQQYPRCKEKCGKGNPVLNLVIFGARRWANSVAGLSGKGRPAYKMTIFVQGLANDTGFSDKNLKLADERRSSVIEYLTGSGKKKYDRRNYEGNIVPPLSADTKIGSDKGMRFGDIVDIKPVATQPDPTDDIVMIMTGKKKSDLTSVEWEQIRDKVKGEEWRKAIITYQIYKLDGGQYREITVDEFIQERIHGMSPKKGE